jgi:hypothetical protein
MRNQIQNIAQLPSSLELTPYDFWLFLRLKMGLRGHCFASVEEIQQYMTAGLRAVPEEDLKRCFQQWLEQVCSTSRAIF